jgi:pectinesterase
MESYGIPCSVRVITDSPHTFWLFHPWHERVAGYAVEFLDRVLKKR